YRNIEIIIVDDASTDDTLSVVKKIDDPRIKCVPLEQNSGPSTARNAGVKLAQGRFVAFLDSDDEWDTKKIDLQLTAIGQQADPGNIVCYTQATMVGNGKTYLLPTRGKKEDESVGDYVLRGNHGAISTSSIMLARKLALANPFPANQKVFEDWDMLLRLEDIGVDWVYLDQPLFTWHNDFRENRLSFIEHDGSAWLDEHKHYLSKQARLAFSMKGIVYPLLRARQRKLYSLKLLLFAFLGNEITFTRFLKYTTKIFLPPALLTHTKALLVQRRTNS
ncbi:MAG TPA: glycosyltransferase, partial [Gammaproteobacteria bacterium]|nr:glycosyltransferase [Gammaproteobacteria bacterium]